VASLREIFYRSTTFITTERRIARTTYLQQISVDGSKTTTTRQGFSCYVPTAILLKANTEAVRTKENAMLDLNDLDYAAIFRGDTNNVKARRYPCYPLLAPEMPPAGPDFVDHALALDGVAPIETTGKGKDKRIVNISETLQRLYLRALYDSDFTMPVKHKGRTEVVKVVLGHVWGYDACGPVYISDEELAGRPRILVVGKMPGNEEVTLGRNFTGPSGQQLRETLIHCGLDDEAINQFYVTNVCRWPMPAAATGAMPATFIKDCAPLLAQELRLFRPDYILCLGAEATKAICGSNCSVSNMIGRYIEIQIPLHDCGESPVHHKAKVMAITHPAAVLRTTELYPQFEATLRNFVELTKGNDFAVSSDKSVKWTAISKERDLAEYVDFVLRTPGLKKIAIDCEWHGSHPNEPNSYLRTIQISANGKFAAVIVMRHQGGAPAFAPSLAGAIRQLNRLLDRDDVQLIGSFIAADLPWLVYNGVNIRNRIRVPGNFDEFRGGDYPGVFDVALAHHAVNETGDYKLEVMGSRLCGTDRWDVDLQQWKHNYCAEYKIKAEELGGYGECPAEILFPYGAKDVAITWRLAELHKKKLLDADQFGNECWTPFHISMMAFPAFNEMGIEGVKVDPQRIDDLTDLFRSAAHLKIGELREAINWPNFNPRSSQQCVELLFGEQYSTKIDKDTGCRIRVRPTGAMSLGLTPVKSTGKGTDWARIVARGEVDKYTPCTDKEVCGILSGFHPVAKILRDVRLIDHVTKSVFRMPKMKGNEIIIENGRRKYGGGVAYYISSDGRVRSTFVQVKETGRASSARPPLQNLSKRREDDYKRILGPLYKWVIRSFITSNVDPEYGEESVLLEADFKGAELFVMAAMARDEQMLDHCLRGNLSKKDSNYYDMHAQMAVKAFNLDCAPTKKGLEDIGKSGLRVAAKNQLFGLLYGRSAAACARQCNEEKQAGDPDITEAQAQRVINTIYETYPGIPALQEALRARAHNPGWLRNPYGRLRRCIGSDDRAAMGELERQFLNFVNQSTVADAMSLALYQLYTHPRKAELGYKIVLQIHDAVILEVPARSLDTVYGEIIPACMIDAVSFKSCDLNGVPYTDSPDYRFGVDVEVACRWGEPLTVPECDALGINHRYAKA
jgi:uracil-DNA glycosylase family 4